MQKKLKFKDKLFIGSMLFGLFFGAGNLIFPVHMGQEAGANIFSANLGFLITGIGLPFLGVIAIGISNSKGVYELASKIHPTYAKIFTVLLYLVIGPFFALPRLATTSFEIGVAPFLGNSSQVIFLALFSAAFFFSAWWFSRKPSKLLVYVGKLLNPAFLVLLGVVLLLGFIHPLGKVSDAAVQASYQNHSFFAGFTQGYNTLDALAALAFGIIVISTIKNMGVEKPAQVTKYTVQSGAISILLMGIIYTLLSFLGAFSLGKFPLSENGGIALAQIAHYYLGDFGSLLLSFIVIIACLKTAIGLVTSFSETFAELFPKRSYAFYIAIVSILPGIFANVGLTNIISISTPVLMFLYPLAITLILLALIEPLIGYHKPVYVLTTAFTLIASIADAVNSLPDSLKGTEIFSNLLDFCKNWLPFFDLGMAWVTPAIIGFIIGIVVSLIRGKTLFSKKQS